MSSRHCYVNVLNPSVFVDLYRIYFCYSLSTFFLDDVAKSASYQDPAAMLMRTIKGSPCIVFPCMLKKAKLPRLNAVAYKFGHLCILQPRGGQTFILKC